MANTKPRVAGADAGEPAVEREPALTINEFCARLSETVRRPELLSAFHRVETAAGRVSDTAAAYRERFDAFINLPV